jgi:hypothetical protein
MTKVNGLTKIDRVKQAVLEDPHKSHYTIAREIGCSPSYVWRARRTLGMPLSPEDYEPNTVARVVTIVTPWFLDLHGNPTRLVKGVEA